MPEALSVVAVILVVALVGAYRRAGRRLDAHITALLAADDTSPKETP